MIDMWSELSEVQFASIVIDVLVWVGIIDVVLDVNAHINYDEIFIHILIYVMSEFSRRPVVICC